MALSVTSIQYRFPVEFSKANSASVLKYRKIPFTRILKIAKSDYKLPHEQLGSHWTDFYQIWYLNIFRKSVEKVQVWLKSNKNNGYFTWRPTYIYDNISLISP
jgi:hypothetical protein